jgi:oligoribonuclease
MLPAIMAEDKPVSKLFWLDMEMTGLDPTKERILEVAVVVTDLNFEVVEEYRAVVHQPEEVLRGMDKWCVETHGKSGLTAEVKDGRPLEEVEGELVSLAKKHFNGQRVVLCGNSIGHDRKFIDAFMPKFQKRLHYRVIDVSSFKEVYLAKFGVKFPKSDKHRARDDIFESIHELKHYLSFVKTA